MINKEHSAIILANIAKLLVIKIKFLNIIKKIMNNNHNKIYFKNKFRTKK